MLQKTANIKLIILLLCFILIFSGSSEQMVYIEGGTFDMGGYMLSESFYPKVGLPVYKVTVNSLYIYHNLVPQREWREIMGYNTSLTKGDNLPFEHVSWYDAVEFCNKKSLKEGLNPAYIIDKNKKDPQNTNVYDKVKWRVTWDKTANGYRLPTEAEWEYVIKEKWGKTSFDKAEYNWQWCWDWYGDNFNMKKPEHNPLGPQSGFGRVIRGGAFDADTDQTCPVDRNYSSPADRDSYISIRLVKTAF